MQIQVNTDNHINGSAKLTHQIENVVANALGHFGDRITRVEVYLSDKNSRLKYGDNDKRCVVVARLAGMQPIAVSHQGAFLGQALNGAAGRLKKTVKRTIGRLKSAKGSHDAQRPIGESVRHELRVSTE